MEKCDVRRMPKYFTGFYFRSRITNLEKKMKKKEEWAKSETCRNNPI